jgi:hypothetical protein
MAMAVALNFQLAPKTQLIPSASLFPMGHEVSEKKLEM